MIRLLAQIVGIAIFIGVIAAFGYAVSRDWDRISSLPLTPVSAAAFVLCSFVFLATQGMILREVVKPFGIALGQVEAFGILAATFFANYVLPFVGVGLRGAYLYRRHGLTVGHYLSTSVAILIVELVVYFTGAVAALVAMSLAGIAVNPLIYGLCVLGLLGCVLVFVTPMWVVPPQFGLRGFAVKVRAGIDSVFADHRVLAWTVVHTVAEYLAFVGMFGVALHLLGLQVPVASWFVTASLTDLAFLFRLAPAAAGTFEAAVYYGLATYGPTLTDALIVSLIVRLALAVVFLPAGGVFFWSMFRGVVGPAAGPRS